MIPNKKITYKYAKLIVKIREMYLVTHMIAVVRSVLMAITFPNP